MKMSSEAIFAKIASELRSLRVFTTAQWSAATPAHSVAMCLRARGEIRS